MSFYVGGVPKVRNQERNLCLLPNTVLHLTIIFTLHPHACDTAPCHSRAARHTEHLARRTSHST